MAHGSPSYEIKSTELKRRRELAGWSLRELAAKCEAAGQSIHYSRISEYENGYANPRPRVLKVLAEVLGCKPDDLIERAVA